MNVRVVSKSSFLVYETVLGHGKRENNKVFKFQKCYWNVNINVVHSNLMAKTFWHFLLLFWLVMVHCWMFCSRSVKDYHRYNLNIQNNITKVNSFTFETLSTLNSFQYLFVTLLYNQILYKYTLNCCIVLKHIFITILPKLLFSIPIK